MKNHLLEYQYQIILRIINKKENLVYHILNMLINKPLQSQNLIKNSLHTFEQFI